MIWFIYFLLIKQNEALEFHRIKTHNIKKNEIRRIVEGFEGLIITSQKNQSRIVEGFEGWIITSQKIRVG